MKNLNFLFILIVSALLMSCSQDENDPKLLFENSGWFYSYEVYGRNKNNDSGFYSYSGNIGGFQTKKSSIKGLIALSTLDSYEHSKVDVRNIKDTILHNVYFKGSWNAKAKKQFLSDVLNYYNLKLNKKEVQEDFFEIYIIDPEKLKKYKSKDQNGFYGLKSENDLMVSTNTSLDEIPNTLKGNVVYNGNNTKKYDFQFVYDSIQANKKYFKKYGLAYRKIQEPVLHYIIEQK